MKTLVSQELFANIGLRKKLFQNSQNFQSGKCYLHKILSILPWEAFFNISMYLYKKNILEYAKIAQNEMESKIPYIESHSINSIVVTWKSYLVKVS